MRRLLPATTEHRIVASMAALIAVATGFRAWSMRGTWFYLDDWPMLAHAINDKLTGPYLMDPYVGHLMPGGRLVTWLLTRAAPLEYAPFAVMMLAFFALSGVGMARLLVAVFGRRWGILPPLVVYLFSPLLAASTLWWAAGVNQLPALIAITWGTDAHVRYLRTRRTSYIAVTAGWVVFGLAFAELALITYLFIAVITVLYFTTGKVTDRFRQVLAEHRRALVVHGLVAAAYVAVYLPTYSELRTKAPDQSLVSYFVEMGAKAFASGAVGGPLTWQKIWSAQFETHPSSWFLLLAWGVLIGLLLASEGTRARGLRAILLVLVVLAAQVGLMYTGRAVFGPTLGLDVRYLFDLAPAFALFLGLAFMPVLGSTESATTKKEHWFVDDHRKVAAALVAFVGLAVYSASTHPLRHLGPDDPRPYFETVKSQVAERSGEIQMSDEVIPHFIFWAPESRYGSILRLVSHRVVSPEVGVDDVYVTDREGRLEPTRLNVVRREDTSEAHKGTCAFPAENGVVDVPLDGPVIGYGWTVRIDYTSEKHERAVISLGDVETSTTLPAGSHALWLPGNAAYDSVRISGISDDTEFCVHHVTMGMIKLDY